MVRCYRISSTATNGLIGHTVRMHCTYAVQSTAVDAPLSRIQLALYPLITIIAPYAFSKAQAHMTEHHFDRAPTESPAFALFSLSEQLQRVWHMASLLNFGLFLWNGKYRTITDRLLGMRLTYANRALHRNVSFEFLNRQLVWNAFTEFLLFLLPLIRPQRIWRRIARWPTHPWVLRTLYDTLPTPLSRRLGLQLDEHTHAVRLARRSPRTPTIGKYWYLPDECCALCFQRLERAAGVEVDAVVPPPMPRHMTSTVAIPTADPLHPRRGLVARRQGREREGDDTLVDNKLVVDRAAERALKLAERRAARQAASARPAAVTEKPSLYGTSPNGIAYMDALLVTPYQALPCASQGHTCRYCYYCIADKLLDDAMADELQDTGGWPCLRCGEPIWGAERVVESATA